VTLHRSDWVSEGLDMTTRQYLDDVKRRIKSIQQSPEQEEFYKQVGRLVIILSEIEQNLAVVYMSLCFSDPDAAAKRYYALPTFEKRLKLVGNALEKDPTWDGDIEVWHEFKNFLRQQKTIRNMVAHQAPSAGHTAVSPTWLLKNSKGRPLTADEIRDAADELDALNDMARALCVRLGAHDGIWGGWEPK
jgi:hypothetical protein